MNVNADKTLMQKKSRLLDCLRGYETLGVAFSGGVDSSLLLTAARHVLGDRVIAMTARSAIRSKNERESALALAHGIGVRHLIFDTHEMDDPVFTANDPQRCYHCKKALFKTMCFHAGREKISMLVHGANVDDLSDFRPGFKAAQEMEVRAPLIEAQLSKADIRLLAKDMNLPNWNKPAMACLATRIPYGVKIEADLLSKIEKAETILTQFGVEYCRVRHYGSLACIEIREQEMEILSAPARRKQIVDAFHSIGYAHIALDLEGYISGKMNRDII